MHTPAKRRLAIDMAPDDKRLAEWREVYGRAIVRLDLEPTPETPFRFQAGLQTLPGVVFAEVRTSGVKGTRTRDLVSDASDMISLVAIADGKAAVSHRNHEITLNPGETVFMRSSEPGQLWFPGSAHYYNIAFPAELLSPAVRGSVAYGAAALPADSHAARLAMRYASLILAEDGAFDADGTGRLIAGHFLDLATALLAEAGAAAPGGDGGGIRAARIKALKADIAQHLTNPELSLSQLARRHQITPRYIGKLFAGEGTSFSKYLLDLRLARAHGMLGDPRFGHLKISSVAFESGFGDLSYFNRAFRMCYGATPSEIRSLADHQE